MSGKTLRELFPAKATEEMTKRCRIDAFIGRIPRVLEHPAEGSPVWPRSSIYGDAPPLHIFDCVPRSKRVWIDARAGYCHLCAEPVSNLSTHSGWWDHVNYHYSLRHLSVVDRPSDQCLNEESLRGPAVLQSSRRYFPKVEWNTPRRHPSLGGHICHVYEKDDLVRLITLRHLLEWLCQEGVLTFALGEVRHGAVNEGERMFRADVSRQCQMIFPPLSPQCMTRIQQKCWGRKNLEVLFDTLRLGDLQTRYAGVAPSTEKDDKGAILMPNKERNKIRFSSCTSTGYAKAALRANGACSPRAYRADAAVLQIVSSKALHCMAFELIALRSAQWIDSSWAKWVAFGAPTSREMEDSSFY